MSTSTSTLEKIKISPPPKFKVILKDNGDGSPIVGKSDFIRSILLVAFNVEPRDAVRLIRKLDNDRLIVIGTYSKQIAETMVSRATELCERPENKRFRIESKMEKE